MHITNLLTKAEAHVDLRQALKNFPRELRGRKPDGGPHTPWQLLEHIRIAQWDILEFSRSAKHKSPKWPDEYWPKTEAPQLEKEKTGISMLFLRPMLRYEQEFPWDLLKINSACPI